MATSNGLLNSYDILADQNKNFGYDAMGYTNQALLNNNKISNFAMGADGLVRPNTLAEPKTFLGLEQGTWGGLGAAGQLLGGAIGAYTGLENLGLARKALDYNMAMGDKQYAMAKDAYDRNVARAEHIGNQMNRSAKTVGEANV
jgi:hypothetical protein